jgi:pyruvate/2-oxoglutarate dehydrogenase complex dihydrolipoamide dehydrogenase (E3) component
LARPGHETQGSDSKHEEAMLVRTKPNVGRKLGAPHRHILSHHRPKARIVGSEQGGGVLRVRLDTGETVDVDHILYTTGYEVNLQRVPFLKAGNLIDRIKCRDGFPVLDNSLQTTVPGLFITSLPAARDFGLFFAFTAAVPASARIVGRAI